MDAETLALLAFQASHILTRRRRDSSGKQRRIIRSTFADRQCFENGAADHFLDDRILCIENRRLCGDRNGLRHRAGRQAEIYRCRESRGDFDALSLRRGEARLPGRDDVNARR